MRVVDGSVVILALILQADVAKSAEDEVLSYDMNFFEQSQPRTALDMIGRLPGFSFDSGTLARGFAGTGGNVLVDGQRPTSKTDSLAQVLQRIPAGDVQRIEVISGGAPGIDMQGHSMVANIVRRIADAKTIVITAENSFSTQGQMTPGGRIEIGRQAGDTTYESSLSVLRYFDAFPSERGHRDFFSTSGELLRREEVDRQVGGLGGELTGAVVRPLADGQLRFNVLLRHKPWDTTLAYASAEAQEKATTHQRTPSGELGLNWTGEIGTVEVQALALQRLSRDTLTDTFDSLVTQRFSSRSTSGETIVRTTLRRPLADALTVNGGAEATFNFLDGNSSFEVDGVAVTLPSPEVRVEERRGEVFGQVSWKPAAQWLLEAGARFELSALSFDGDSNASQSFFYPKPRLLLAWGWDRDSQLRLRYEQAVDQLAFGNFIATSNLAERGITAGNGSLEPAQRRQYELAFEHRFLDRGAILISLLHEQIENVVDVVPVATGTSVFDAPGNIGHGRNDHIEASVTLPLDHIRLTPIKGGLLNFRGVWNSSQVRDPVTRENRAISDQLWRTLDIRFSQDLPQLRSSWGISYLSWSGRQRYRLAEIETVWGTPSVSTGGSLLSGFSPLGPLSMFWNYQPNPSLALRLDVMNITGFDRRVRRDIYAGPRDTAPLVLRQEFALETVPVIAIQVRWNVL